ncbi:MAG: hypothetical protein ACOY7J_02095 [Pseudomonadota bacterium]
MTLLALLLALWAVKEAYVPAYFADGQWGLAYLNRFQQQSFLQSLHPAAGYGLYVLPPTLLGWLVGTHLEGWVFTLTGAVLAVVLLTACLDFRRLEATLVPFLKRWRNKEWQAAYEHGTHTFDYGRMVSPSELLSQTVTQYWVRINQTLFAPLFWYGIFGLGGLALYLFTVLLPRVPDPQTDVPSAWKKIGIEFLHALDGVPARAVAMTIAALCFNGKAFAVAVRRFRATDREAEIVLKLAVKMGLDFKDLPTDEDELASEGIRRIHSAQDLRSNVLIFWIVVIAILTIIS